MDDARVIENLIYTYAERIDAGDLEGVAALFQNATISSPQHSTSNHGYEEVLAMYKASCRLYPDCGTPKTRHLTSNVIIEVEQSQASARSCYTVFQSTPKLGLQPIISGRYNDSFSLYDGNWRFAKREMFVDLLGDLSAHLLYDASRIS